MTRRTNFPILGLFFLASLLISGFAVIEPDKPSERDRLFNNGWRFIRDSLSGAEQPEFDDSKWMRVDLPHDYSIMNLPGPEGPDQVGPFSKRSPGNGNSTGHVIGGTGWYRKNFTLGKTDGGETVILNFDGVYMESEVWVNGKRAGDHKNGYTPFWFDITSLLNPTGKPNIVAVRVNNTGRNSRWYSGSGIYRDVYLTVTKPVHVSEWGVYITTPAVRQNSAIVDIAVTARNDGEKQTSAKISISLIDKYGKVAAASNDNITISGKADNTIRKQVEIKNPILWSVESPDLYQADIVIEADSKISDKYSMSFGIRSAEFSAEKGFLLNGKQVRLKGGCMHHDNGLLGSAAYEAAETRKVEIMKANGYNAVRCAHNPPSQAFLNACDKLGMLVIDEFTDMWEFYKNPQDYSRFFRQWWKKDLTDMIMRDRNHPGIIMWSIGNEIYEQNDTSRLRIGKQLSGLVRGLDNTRAVTQAITGFFYPDGWETTERAFSLLDVCGYNYAVKKYESDHKKFPQRIMFASESYPIDAYDYWSAVEKNPYVIGDFVWTSMDYIGEVLIGSATIVPAAQRRNVKIPEGFKFPAGFNIFDYTARMPSTWPYFLSWCGDIDITGEKKPQMLYRDILWDNSKIEMNVRKPVPQGFAENISLWGWPDELPTWNWKGSEGEPLQVRVFTRASNVRLELNGKCVGEKTLLADDKYIAVFDVPYQPGVLKAIASDNGRTVATKVLETAGEPSAIKLIADSNIIKADRGDLSFVKIEVVDVSGRLVTQDSISVKLILEGKGELIASGNADPKDMASVNEPRISLYHGRGLAIIRPSGPGEISLMAESKGLKTGELTIKVSEQALRK